MNLAEDWLARRIESSIQDALQKGLSSCVFKAEDNEMYFIQHYLFDRKISLTKDHLNDNWWVTVKL